MTIYRYSTPEITMEKNIATGEMSVRKQMPTDEYRLDDMVWYNDERMTYMEALLRSMRADAASMISQALRTATGPGPLTITIDGPRVHGEDDYHFMEMKMSMSVPGELVGLYLPGETRDQILNQFELMKQGDAE